MADEFLSPRQVADEYPFSQQQLATWRWMGLGPDYIKTTPSKAGRIKYRRSAIERWLNEHTVSHRGAA
ncbi:DNA-binding protein [Streptomyces sp. NPDC046853]|uniref:helix-turn-helix transcriptional regulator n=1 Tax=Streptomyces sp. NPDC046853 TaxID=3154920 RepID=UPI0033CA4F5A